MNPQAQRGFTLIELAIVLFILTLLMAGVMTPLTQQLTEHQIRRTQHSLEEMKAALLGYALSHRDALQRPYLPCPDRREAAPADQANDGKEDRLPNGRCAVIVGNLPWISLGVSDADAWGNHFSYAVSPDYANSSAGIAAHPAPAAILRVCLERTCRNPVTAAALLLSHGRNGLGALNAAGGRNLAASGADERQNSDADSTFVSRAPAAADRAGGEFDDLVVWLSPDYLIGRLCGYASAC